MRRKNELRKLAIDIYKGQIFGTWQIKNPNNVGAIFMCVLFMDKKMVKKLETQNIVHFCEYLSKAGPMAVNGMPTFCSMQTISRTEWDIIVPIIEKLQKAELELIEEKE